MGAVWMGSRDDKLQWKLHALLIPIIAIAFVLWMGELRFWFVGIVIGVIIGFLASGAIVWFWADVLNRSLGDDPRPSQGHENADVRRLSQACHYIADCGELTLPKAFKALRIARRMEWRQTLLNTWATHKPNEVREFLREQFEASANEIADQAQADPVTTQTNGSCKPNAN